MKKLITFLFITIISSSLYSQTWLEMMQEPGRNFYEIQSAFNNYWKDKDITEKGKGYKPFKRWEHFVEQRVYPSGNLSLISNNWKNFEAFLRENTAASKSSAALSSTSTWTAMGPMGAMTGLVGGLPAKAGRDNFVTFDPNNPSTYWCGSPAGGLWKTTNNGSTWSTSTDYLPVIGCSDLAIDPTNPNIMYLATGDSEGDTYSIGVLKSTDGGLTWNPTGLVYTVNQQKQMRRILVNPVNPLIVLALGNFGIQRSVDGGVNWAQIQTGNFYDAEFKPGNPNVIYAAANALYRSLNGGVSFSIINSTNGIPAGANRMNVGVTPADTNYVYLLASKSSNSGLLGVFRSTNGGNSFTTMTNSPDILANPCSPGATTGGQGWYDLALAVSPLDKNEVVVGGVNVWKSVNGGSSFSVIGCWNSTGTNFVHADQHELEYTPTGTLYVSNDGGIFEYTAPSWTDRSSPRNIAQMYKIGLSSLSPNLWITGHQDNGSNIFNGTNYVAAVGGDGMDCFIDRTNNNTMFASLQNGGFRRSFNGGASWSSIVVGLTPGAGWVSPWKQDPLVATTLYAGYSQLFVSTNSGGGWTQLTNTGGSGYVIEFAIAPSNNQIIYVIHGTSLRKTIDGGLSWTNVTSNVPTGSGAPTFITIDPTDPDNVWVTLSGYSAPNKVFQTTNGGVSWTNITYNLPNLPANCSVYQPATNDRIYIGMDVGVYVKDNSSNIWSLYNNSLPNVPVHDMEISPAAPTLLRAATYGRGVYQVDLIQPTTVPSSSINTEGTICQGASKTFIDLSTEDPTSWNWSVSPSSGVTINSANSQNPNITFQTTGVYTVSLTATNGFGSGAPAVQTITVYPNPTLTLNTSVNSLVVCIGEDIVLTASGAANYTWQPGNKTGSTLSITTPTVPNSITYTVNGKDVNGCSDTELLSLVISECTGISNKKTNDLFIVFPNPASNLIMIKNQSGSSTEAEIELEDSNGKVVLRQTLEFKKDKNEMQINISTLANGIYILKFKTEKGGTHSTKIVKE
ncbi:T9SS type A sorting domain-containing protein [Aurantibacillus circumpalustris]|uniref:T9SS type A sorting domain-containing protein n=1 Tax=Aurantibacillus circumpalustris TaxID=3036359 RepID=UPI00295B84EA|nr:T9SS type A sorting domain-containing protein [Aurantibacillus circumpalustris]